VRDAGYARYYWKGMISPPVRQAETMAYSTAARDTP